MAITTLSKVAVSLNMSVANQTLMNVWTYNVLEVVGTPTAAHYAEAWWNHVKASYRALATSNYDQAFRSVRVTELGNPTGEYGEFAIPVAEQTGTRANPADPDAGLLFSAAGVRLTVGSRVTRPGQKRIPFLNQTDQNGQLLGSAFKTLVNTLMSTMTANLILGAPAAGVVLVPFVVGLNADGTIRNSQPVTGYVINDAVVSQVSRRVGRGI